MRIEINYIGLIQAASIDVNSITVIAGNNNTGKSTVGKALYSVATGLNLLKPSKVLKEKVEAIANRLYRINRVIPVDADIDKKISNLYMLLLSESFLDMTEEASLVDSIKHLKSNNEQEYQKKIEISFDTFITSEVNMLFDEILERDEGNRDSIQNLRADILEISKRSISDDKFRSNIMQKVFDIEFAQQITNVHFFDHDASVSIQEINQPEIKLTFNKHKLISELSQIQTNRVFSKAIYIDNPFILDDGMMFRAGLLKRRNDPISHRGLVRELVMPTERLLDENLFELNAREEKIHHLFDQVFNDGKLLYKNNSIFFKENDNAPLINFENLSTGMKSFSILYMLIQSNSFDECEYIILDEPEIHLHPDWQLKYAELIVLVSKSFNLKLIITSHSPYFIEAIELYAKKHSYDDDLKFYRTVQNNLAMNYSIEDVTEKLPLLYHDLANAFYSLEELRDELSDDE